MHRLFHALIVALMLVASLSAQGKLDFDDKFRQLEEILPTPNDQRTASGAPARDYWQQRADHDIRVEIDDENQRLIGSETITYTNNSPDRLDYIWLQLDQNRRALTSDSYKIATNSINGERKTRPTNEPNKSSRRLKMSR